MARTLNQILKRRSSSSLSSSSTLMAYPPINEKDHRKKLRTSDDKSVSTDDHLIVNPPTSGRIVSDIPKRKSTLDRWMNQSKPNAAVVMILDSSDEEDFQITERVPSAHFRQDCSSTNSSDATAIELDTLPPKRSARRLRSDRLFTGAYREVQCHASTGLGIRCDKCAVGGTKYCHLHENYQDHLEEGEDSDEFQIPSILPDSYKSSNVKEASSSSSSSEEEGSDDSDSVQSVASNNSTQKKPQQSPKDLKYTQCIAVTVRRNLRCSNMVCDGYYCRYHKNQPQQSPEDLKYTQCMAVTSRSNRRCSNMVRGGYYCRYHKMFEDGDDDEAEDSDDSVSVQSVASNENTQKQPQQSPKDLKYTQCIAVTIRRKNRRCSNMVCDGQYCRYHKILQNGDESHSASTIAAKSPRTVSSDNSQNEFDFEQSVAAEAGSTTSPSSASVDNSKGDTLYRRGKGQERCIAINAAGKACIYSAVNSSVFCYYHGKRSSIFKDVLCPSKEEDSDSNESSSESDDESFDSDDFDENDETRPYRYSEFLQMWEACEEYCGEETDEIESTRRIRGANKKMSCEDTDGQLKAQYGRLLPRAMQVLMKNILRLKKADVFLDIGHGIGNTCMQAAFTVGCEARGIEVVYDRNSVAEVFRDNLVAQNKDSSQPRMVGNVALRHGRLEDEKHLEFLTKGVTSAYVNNFNGVFAERSSKSGQKWFLDDYVAGLFALMAPGTVMVTLHPLNLGPTKNEANQARAKFGLSKSENSGFYEVERVLLGKACDTVKWNQHSGNQKNIYVYKYTRLAQPFGEGAVFLCCNHTCPYAKDDLPILATTKNEEGRIVINHCECKVTAKNLRRQRRKVYKDY